MAGRLQIHTLGGLTVTCDGQPVSGFASRKVLALTPLMSAPVPRRYVPTSKRRLDTEVYAAAWARGQELDFKTVIAALLREFEAQPE